MMRRRQEPQRRAGIATVELAVVLPLLVTMLVGLLEVARVITVKLVVADAAREGGRLASTGRFTNSQVQQFTISYLASAGFATQNAVVTISNVTNPGTDVSAAAQLDEIQVTVSIPFNDVRLVNLRLVTNSSTVITSQSTWFSLKDKPYPDPDDPAPE